MTTPRIRPEKTPIPDTDVSALGEFFAHITRLLLVTAPGGAVYRHAPRTAADINRYGKSARSASPS